MTPASYLHSKPPRKPYAAVWEAVDGLASGEIVTTHPEGDWPAMVELQLYGPACGFGFLMTVLDAQNLATDLAAAAEWAQFENKEAKRQEESRSGEVTRESSV